MTVEADPPLPTGIIECIAMAYDKNGKPKRTIGIWYKDLGCTWTKEMELEKKYGKDYRTKK